MESILKCLERAGILLAVAEPVPEFFVTIGFGWARSLASSAGARCRHRGTESRPGWPQKLRPPSQTSDTLMWQDCLGESRKIRTSRVLSIIEQLAPCKRISWQNRLTKENELLSRSRFDHGYLYLFSGFIFCVAPASLSAEEKKPPPRSITSEIQCAVLPSGKAKTYIQTAHRLASSWPSPRTMKGSFTPGSNVLKTSNPYLTFEMTVNEHGYFQSAVEQLSPPRKFRAQSASTSSLVGQKRTELSILERRSTLPTAVTYWTAPIVG